ncbi:Hypothetical predicted protein [Mytilus galloprovincialis]|uniref:COR domain-containing protein n=1 Tax=Mytilus galloprovincialis TaxID=29158 RepID=A0A8B6FIE3_MYTGA|nr:Hypothetical predicted protein [Mytilus galloprovincialis]
MENWNKKLLTAAEKGRVEELKLCIEKGANVDYKDWNGGFTALILAVKGGHLDVTRLLLDRGCNKDDTDWNGGFTALMMAARQGRLDVIRLLLARGCNKETTHDETPYDLAAKNGKNEVMDFLKTVMTKKSSEADQTKHTTHNEDGVVPTEIRSMTDKGSIDLYLKLLESGSEKKRDIRLVVVGKKGAGKTSLIRRLFGEEIEGVSSTNKIEIHRIKCKAMSDEGIWNKLDKNYEETETHARLLKEYEGQLQDKTTVGDSIQTHIAITDSTEQQQPEKAILNATEPQVQPQSEPPVAPQQSNESYDKAVRDFETMFTAKSESVYMTKRNLFRLWMDSIHCYSRHEEDNNKSHDSKATSGDLDPPVVIIGTWKDAMTSEADTVEEACREKLLLYTEHLADDERGHIRFEYFISYKDDERSVFAKIRQNILNLARGMRTWNKEYPLKFIQLEQRLQEKKKELPIISYQEMKNISSDTPKPLSEEELILFLEFHHELRALVYFKDLSEYIILDTQWLSDAFRCIVTAQKFRINIRNQKEWNIIFSKRQIR